MVSQDDYEIAFFQPPGPASSQKMYFWVFGTTPTTVCFTAGLNEYPNVIVLSGPNGTGHYAHLYSYTYDKKALKWIPTHIKKLKGLIDYRYLPDKGIFEYEQQISKSQKNGVQKMYHISGFIAPKMASPYLFSRPELNNELFSKH